MPAQPLPEELRTCGMQAGTQSADEVAEIRSWDRHEIAELSDEQIESMLNPELFGLIRASEHPCNDREMERHLKYADRSTLLRLAYLARNCCRNAECAAFEQALMDELDGPLNRRDAGTLFGNPR